jgi:hypothetical protein
MTRVATVENEDYLLNIAEYGTAQHMEVLVKAYRRVSRIADTAEDFNAVAANECKQSPLGETQHELRQQQHHHENRSVTCYQDDDEMWVIKAKLPPEEGALVAKALQELGDSLADTKKNEADNAEVKKSEKDVSAETETFSLDKQEEPLTFPQRRADALVAFVEHYLASDSSELSSLKGAERCQLIMHIRAGVHNSDQAASNDASLEGRWLLPNAARRLACDASLLVVKEDEVGNVLDIGRKSRVIPPAMARALAIRDGGCQFPGCCESRYTEGHHIKHWADGGDTRLDNLVTLCRYHHKELHKGSYYLSLKPALTNAKDDKPIRFAERLCFSKVDRYFDAPFNRLSCVKEKDYIIAANPAKFTCACCDDSVETNQLLEKAIPSPIFHKIDNSTAVTKWAGERMDLGMAIEGLLNAVQRRGHGLS